GCACALRGGNGFEKAPWDDWDILISINPILPSSGRSYPIPFFGGFVRGTIDVSVSGNEYSLASTIGHEAGHFRWPFVGHDFRPIRFAAESVCGHAANLDQGRPDLEYARTHCPSCTQ